MFSKRLPSDEILKVYIFNPETDMALASGCNNYTPPINIQRFTRTLALLPALYAETDSYIIVPNGVNHLNADRRPYFQYCKEKGVNLIFEEELQNKQCEIHPWGWDPTLYHRLKRINNLAITNLQEDILSVRKRLSHRRITIDMHNRINTLLSKDDIALPIEFVNSEDAYNWILINPGCYLKSPWSSSGKGIFHLTSTNFKSVKPWIERTISRQGSIMAEVGTDRSLDFATEWSCDNGIVRFEGYSIFEVSEHGRYLGNFIVNHQQAEEIINRYTDQWGEHYLEAIGRCLTEIIAPYYNGPLGIDMLITTDGRINPCVEINLRMTMGHVALSLLNNGCKSRIFRPGEILEW